MNIMNMNMNVIIIIIIIINHPLFVSSNKQRKKTFAELPRDWL